MDVHEERMPYPLSAQFAVEPILNPPETTVVAARKANHVCGELGRRIMSSPPILYTDPTDGTNGIALIRVGSYGQHRISGATALRDPSADIVPSHIQNRRQGIGDLLGILDLPRVGENDPKPVACRQDTPATI
jgi:hypothetical protein